MARVLVVTIDPALTRRIGVHLETTGHTIEPIESPAQALTALERAAPDDECVLLLDPIAGAGAGLDGFQLQARLRASPKLAGTPCVLLMSQMADAGEDQTLYGDRGFHLPCPLQCPPTAWVPKARPEAVLRALTHLLSLPPQR